MKTKGASDNLLSTIEYPKFVKEKLPYFQLSCTGTTTRSWYNNWLPYLISHSSPHVLMVQATSLPRHSFTFVLANLSCAQSRRVTERGREGHSDLATTDAKATAKGCMLPSLSRLCNVNVEASSPFWLHALYGGPNLEGCHFLIQVWTVPPHHPLALW